MNFDRIYKIHPALRGAGTISEMVSRFPNLKNFRGSVKRLGFSMAGRSIFNPGNPVKTFIR
jgi:hypothetical protein